MKNSTKILIGVVVVALIGAAVYFGNTKLQKGSLGDIRNSFIVSLASTPVSETVLPGQNVNMIGLNLTTGDGGNVTISKITIKLLADDDGDFEYVGYGDTPANTIIETVSLYKANPDGTETKITEPVGLTSTGTINQAKYYGAVFQNLNYTISKFITEKWLVKAKIANNISKTYYIAADLKPNIDIESTVTAKNGSGLDGNGVNGLQKKSVPTVFKTIAVEGTLNISQEGSPAAAIIVGGKVDAEFAKYKFTATNEAFTVKKLSIVIDSDSNFKDNPVDDTGSSNNIVKVSLAYPKKDGAIEKVSAVLSSGIANFTNLNFYVPQNGNATVTVLADINTMELGANSGAQVRLGLGEYVGNNGFEALGENSGATVKFSDIATVTSSAVIKSMTVRKTVPVVAKLATASSKLVNGQNDIAAITISANEKEAVAIKKLTFQFSYSGNLEISALDLIRKIGSGTELTITDNVSIKDKTGSNLKSGGAKLADAARYKSPNTIYITWDKNESDQEFISKGVNNTYILRATVSGAKAGNTIVTYMPAAETQTSVTDNATNLLTAKYNFIWSDNSAVNHSTLTKDWTTGYLVPTFPSSPISLIY